MGAVAQNSGVHMHYIDFSGIHEPYAVRMTSALTGSFVLQRFKQGNMVKYTIMFDFCHTYIPFQSWLH